MRHEQKLKRYSQEYEGDSDLSYNILSRQVMLDNDPYYQKILAREEEYRFYEERSMAEDILFPEISEDEFIKE